mgnify:FL=1
MRHKKDVRKFSRNKSNRKSLLRNMSISLIQNKRIITTEAKAKQLKRVVEKLITTGKTKDLASIRKINAYLNHPETTAMVIELGQKFKERNGGYIKIIKIGCRSGDASKMAVIQMVE